MSLYAPPPKPPPFRLPGNTSCFRSGRPRSTLHDYRNVDRHPNYSAQNLDPFDKVLFVNLAKDSYVVWDQPQRIIGLPTSTTSVKENIKFKARIKHVVELTVYLAGYYSNKAIPTLDGPKPKSG